ncbi:MAG: MATE family efflux transporter [Candidatus Bipolaricaulaceae bacterium]
MVDAIWVSGLGSEALAAVGLFFPFMMGMLALATGVGVGGSSAVSRRIGAREKLSAERAAILTLLWAFSFQSCFSLPSPWPPECSPASGPPWPPSPPPPSC